MSIKISELNETSTLTNQDVIPVVNSNETKKVTVENVVNHVQSEIGSDYAAAVHTHTKSDITDFPTQDIADLQSDVHDLNTQIDTKEALLNKVTTLSSESTDVQYPSAKVTYDELQDKQTQIDKLLEQLPKGTAEGKNINVTDSSDLQLKDVLIKGNTIQDGTPTPDSPVDIKVVTGDVTVQVSNKNLFNFPYLDSTFNNQHLIFNVDTFTYRGKPSDNSLMYNKRTSKVPCFIPAGSTIKFSYFYKSGTLTSGVINAKPYVYYSDGTSELIGTGDRGTSNYKNTVVKTLTLAKDVIAYDFYLQGYNAIITEELIYNGLLEISSVATNYEPHKGQSQLLSLGNIELCKIGDYQDYIYKDKTSGKWYKHKAIEKILSYNGETITTTYLSTTGELSTGATVYYVLATLSEEEITDTTLLEQLEALYELKTYKNVTNAYTTTQNEVPILNVTYFKDLQTLTDKIATLEARIELLEN